MRVNLKVIALILLLSSSVYAEESNNEEHSKSSASMIQAPLQSELVEVYKGSEKVGKKAGKNTKNFFCSEFGWSFFCKGDES